MLADDRKHFTRILNENNSGPKQEPWGTPYLRLNLADLAPCITIR